MGADADPELSSSSIVVANCRPRSCIPSPENRSASELPQRSTHGHRPLHPLRIDRLGWYRDGQGGSVQLHLVSQPSVSVWKALASA